MLWHIITLKFSSWNIICFWHPSINNLSDFECSNEILPNSSCHFWDHMVWVYTNFPWLFSFMKGNSSEVLQLKPHIPLTKIAHRSEIFRLLFGWVKSQQIPDVFLEPRVSFSSKSLCALDKTIQSKCKFSDFCLLAWKLAKFLM